MSTLEMRYRRLLAVYPAQHRDEYGEEMLGVLMTGARPGQRFPALRDTADLLRNGFMVRMLGPRTPRPRLRGSADAYAIAALIAAMTLLVAAYRNNEPFMPSLTGATYFAGLDYQYLNQPLRAGGWLLVLIALLLGWRRTAIGLGAAATVVEITALAVNTGTAWRWVSMGWVLVAAPITVALLIGARHSRRPAAIVGRRGVTLLLVGLLLCGMSGGFRYLLPGTGIVSYFTIPMLTIGAVLLGWGLVRIPADIWRTLVTPLAGLASILVAQPVMEHLTGIQTRYAVTPEVVAIEIAVLGGIPLVVTLLVRGVVAVAWAHTPPLRD